MCGVERREFLFIRQVETALDVRKAGNGKFRQTVCNGAYLLSPFRGASWGESGRMG